MHDGRKAANNGLNPRGDAVAWRSQYLFTRAHGWALTEEDDNMRRQRMTDLTRVGVTDREANRQLFWTVGWTFTFLFLSICFLQGA